VRILRTRRGLVRFLRFPYGLTGLRIHNTTWCGFGHVTWFWPGKWMRTPQSESPIPFAPIISPTNYPPDTKPPPQIDFSVRGADLNPVVRVWRMPPDHTSPPARPPAGST